MYKFFLIYLFLILCKSGISQTCTTTVYNDRMETYNWAGNWFIPSSTSGFYTNAFTSSNVSASIYGLGSGSSVIEYDWYSLPNITGLNPSYNYQFGMRLGSYRFSNTTAATRGVDAPDFIEIQISTDGEITYNAEIRITGNNNAYWNYNTNGVIQKTSNGTLTTYTPAGGGDRTSTGDGYSVISLNLPPGITQIAVDIYCRINSAGEEWWIDDIELREFSPCQPLHVNLEYFNGKEKDDNVLLEWRTLNELNSNHFRIEKSYNGYYWDFLRNVNAVGNSYEPIDYSTIDTKPNKGHNYYRLTEFDNNGNKEIFDVISVYFEGNNCIYKYYDILGREIDFITAPSGIYIRKCNDKIIEKVWKN